MLLLGRLHGARTLVTIHSGGFVAAVASFGSLQQRLFKFLLAFTDHVVTVNHSQKEYLRDIWMVPVQQVSVIPAYLASNSLSDFAAPEDLVVLRDKGEGWLLMSGYGQSHYGYHELIEAMEGVPERLTHRLVVCVYNDKDEPYLARLQDMAEKRRVKLTILRDRTPEEFAWLLKQSVLYVRSTDRDGDAVAIREALAHGVPVVASNCVTRPDRARVYAVGQIHSLRVELRAALASGAPSDSDFVSTDNGAEILSLYERLLS